MVVSKLYEFDDSVYEYYSIHHCKSDLDIIKDIINEKYPDYSDSFMSIMSSKKVCMLNMMAVSKAKFNEYCEWLFDILFEAEKRINYEDRDSYQCRVFGFLAERLLNVWIVKNGCAVKNLPIYCVKKNKLISKIRSVMRN